ncbi:MAG: nucleotidyltransferase family protein, partial [Sphingomonadales bacterium]
TWELDRLRRVFWGTDQKLMLLKGAAYTVRDLPWARGRISTDVDVLVARAELEGVEAALIHAGWQPARTSEYDQKYYREWMHELPPLRHPERQTVIDVHHTILPPTGRVRVDGARLLERARVVDDRFLVLSDADMLLHSAVHLFQDGEVRGGVRDLLDQAGMIRHFGQDPAFWPDVIARAQELGLTRPLYYSLRYAERLLGAPVPDSVPDHVRDAVRPMGPGPMVRGLMDRLVEAAIAPAYMFEPRKGAALAGEMLYLRSHWLKMPPAMLARHLATKALKRIRFS